MCGIGQIKKSLFTLEIQANDSLRSPNNYPKYPKGVMKFTVTYFIFLFLLVSTLKQENNIKIYQQPPTLHYFK